MPPPGTRKIPIDTQGCPPTATVTGDTWTISRQGNAAGIPASGRPVWTPQSWTSLGPIPIADPYTADICAWRLDTNPATTPAPQLIFNLEYTDIGFGPTWVLTCFNTTNAQFAGVNNALSTYARPVGEANPAGTYTAVDHSGTPDGFSEPPTLNITIP